MSIQMPPSEREQLAQLNSNAMANVAQGGVTEFASDPGVQVAGKGAVVEGLFKLFKGAGKNDPTENIDVKPRVPAEGNLEPDELVYRDTQSASAANTLSDEGQAKFAAQGNRATDLSPSGQRLSQALSEADDAVELTPDQQLRATVTDSQRGVTANNQGFNLTEDSAGVASQSQADEVIEAATIEEGYLRSIKDGAPFNWDKIKQPDDVKALIQAVSDSLPDQQEAATRGVVSNASTLEDATGQLADSLGLTRDILKRKRGTAFANAAEATAARMLLSDSAKKLADLAKQVKEGGGDGVMLQFRRQLAIHNGIQLQIKGAQTEAARLLQSFNIPVTEGMAPDAVALMNMDVIEASGGAKTMKMAADGLLKAAENGEGAFNQAAEKGIMSRFRQGVEHLYINGLLSGPKTQFKNIGGNMLFMVMQVPEEFLAGAIGAAERGIRRSVGSEIDYTQQRYMSDVLARWTGYYRSFGDALSAAAMAVKTNQPGDAVSKVEMNTYRSASIGDTPLARGLDYFYKGTSLPTRLLLGGDDFFKVLSQNGELYAKANRQYKAALANGMSQKEAADEASMVLLSPRQFANELDVKGRYDTLMTDLGKFGESASALQNTWFGRYILPFATAPTNDILRTLERTPIGLAHPEIFGKDAGKRQQRMARVASGGMILSITAMYAGQGRITGATPQNKKTREKLPPGWKPYSFVFPGDDFPVDENGDQLPLFNSYGAPNGPLKYISYSGMGPLASTIGIAAGAMQVMSLARTPEERQNIAAAAVYSVSEYFQSLPMLQGVAQVLSALETNDPDFITKGPLGSMNLVPGVPNPLSALTRTVERIGDNTVTKTGANYDIYTADDVRRMTDAGELKLGPDGNYDFRRVGTAKGEAGEQFFSAVHNGYLQMVRDNVFADNKYAEIPRYDSLGRLVTDGPSYEEAPFTRLYNAFSPMVVGASDDQPAYVDELVRLDWPVPMQPVSRVVKGIKLTEMQLSNLVWIAKGNPDQVPANMAELGIVPIQVRVNRRYSSFKDGLETLMNGREYRRSTDKEKKSLIRSLNDQFMDAAFQVMSDMPGNERIGEAARDIESLKEDGLL